MRLTSNTLSYSCPACSKCDRSTSSPHQFRSISATGTAVQAFGPAAFMMRTPALCGASAAMVNTRTASLSAMIVILPNDHSYTGSTGAGSGKLSVSNTVDRRRSMTSIVSS